jgi:phosphonate transport system ATP-binding protein
MQRPEILLADEPVASLDPESSAQVMQLIREISTERRLTVLCSLHQVNLALSWGDRVIGLRAGKAVLDTPVAGLDPQDAMSLYAKVGAAPLAAAVAG